MEVELKTSPSLKSPIERAIISFRPPPILTQDQKKTESISNISKSSSVNEIPTPISKYEMLKSEGFIQNWERTVHTGDIKIDIKKDAKGKYSTEDLNLAAWTLA